MKNGKAYINKPQILISKRRRVEKFHNRKINSYSERSKKPQFNDYEFFEINLILFLNRLDFCKNRSITKSTN
jgi:hypothetical protein